MAATVTPSDLVALLKRRRAFFLVPFLLVVGLGVAAALLLPSVYQATATIRIDRQQIPRTVLDTTPVTTSVNEYVEVVSQRVLSNDNLLQVAEQFQLFPPPRDEVERQAIGKAMRNNIVRETLYVDLGPPTQRRGESVAVAFTIGYRASDGETARDVANALADLYLRVNQSLRTDRAAQLTEFLKSEAERLSAKVKDVEQRLAEFKERHAGSLPENHDRNLVRMHSLQDQIDRIEERVVALNQQRIALRAELARLDPQAPIVGAERRVLTPSQQVERLRLEYLDLSATYSPLHPDLVRLQNQLRALTGAAPQAEKVLNLITALEQQRTELMRVRQRYSAEHPDVHRAERAVARLKDQLAALSDSGEGRPPASNPTYVTVSTQLQAVESELRAETELRDRLRQRLNEYTTLLAAAPAVERDYRALQREHETALSEYREMRNRLLRAEAAEKVEREHIGDRFSLVSPAVLPSRPVSPNRPGIVIVAVVFALCIGAFAAVAAEYLDQSVSSTRRLAAIIGEPPLATIPKIHGERERRFRWPQWGATTQVVLAVSATALLTLGLGLAGVIALA